MTIEELRDYVENARSQNEIPYHVYSNLIDGIDMLEQEPCEDCISRKTLLETIQTYDTFGVAPTGAVVPLRGELKKMYVSYIHLNDAIYAIQKSPSVQPKGEPRRKGKWIPVDDTLKCSECGFGYFPNDYFFRDGECVSTPAKRFVFKKCPVCGAKMRK